jgi:hypothetical protein
VSAQHTATGQPGGPLLRFRAAFTVLRDVTMTGLALYGIWHQEDSGKVNGLLLLTYVVILGLVPASHALALLRSLPSQLPSSAATPEQPTPAAPSSPAG